MMKDNKLYVQPKSWIERPVAQIRKTNNNSKQEKSEQIITRA